VAKFMTFNLRSEQYGFPIEVVREINRVAEITPVPRTPDFVRGVMNLRGRIIPVVDLRMKLGFEKIENTRDTCIVVIDAEVGMVGLVVDSVREVVDLSPEQIQHPPQMGPPEEISFIQGLGKVNGGVVILINVLSAFSKTTMSELVNVVKTESVAPPAVAA
jgi:purine-binding chemotaxis protein CheW